MDKSYNLQEAAELLDELDEYKETDEGLWEGQEPRDAIATQAAYTYGAAVMSLFQALIKEINNDDDLESLKEQYDNLEDKIQEELDDLEAEHDENEKAKEAADYQRVTFEPPFDLEDKLEQKQEEIKTLIKNRIEEIIDRFDG